jgi:hypothetical protein
MQMHDCHNIVMATAAKWDSTSDLKIAARVFFYVGFSAVAAYLLAFVVLVFVPGVGNKLMAIGVDDALLTKVFYPLLHLIR